jgi:hypothetical protein
MFMNDNAKTCNGNFLRRGCALFLLVCVSLLVSCTYEENTKVSIDGKNPPTFRLTGSGHQMFFVVSEIPPENRVPSARQNPDRNTELWEIVPDHDTVDIASSWPEITYGNVPPGFRQKTPPRGEAPKLLEGNVYAAGGLAYGANGGGIWFTIRNGSAVEIPQP